MKKDNDFFPVRLPEHYAKLETWVKGKIYNYVSGVRRDKFNKRFIYLCLHNGEDSKQIGVVWLSNIVDEATIRRILDNNRIK